MQRIGLHTQAEVTYVLNSLTRWNNNIGEQARRLVTWLKKGWLKQADLLVSVNSLLKEAEGYNLLSRKDVARLVSQTHLTDLVNAISIYTDESPGEEAVAMYMLTAKERGIDVEKAITLYFDFKEQYQQELEEWKAKFDFEVVKKKRLVQKRKKDGTIKAWERRRAMLDKQEKSKLLRSRKLKELAVWIAKNELIKPWAEERKSLPGLEEAEYDASIDKKDGQNAGNQDKT